MPGRKSARAASDEEEELIDTTGALELKSKRSERRRKKQERKTIHSASGDILSLPEELILDIFSYLRPSEILQLSRVNKALRHLVQSADFVIANGIIRSRYSCLERCLRLPVLLQDVDPAAYEAMQSEARQELLVIHKKPYQHVQPPDPTFVCTCLTCILRWNSLCLAVDFAHWQNNLDKGDPIPIIPRGTVPAWNQDLLSKNASVVSKALKYKLWYACVLEVHLATIVRSIRRHSQNKGNKRKRFQLPPNVQDTEVDDFLQAKGPSTLDFPFHRDNYYMLEAYLPNRGWNDEAKRWMYVPVDQHDTDVEFVMKWARLRREREESSRHSDSMNHDVK